MTCQKANRVRPLNIGVRRWGQGRLLEAEEESYFNTDDDDEEKAPINIANAFPKTNNPTLKRKRAVSVPLRSQQQQRPPHVLVPSLGSLVDYDDGEDLGGFGPVEDAPPTFNPTLSNRAAGAPAPPDIPISPRLSHRPLTAGSRPSDEAVVPEDPEDSLLESLVANPNSPDRSVELGLGAKRPRDDEDDELLAIATKSKRPSMGAGFVANAKEGGNGITIKLGGVKTTEEGPKKIKLKLSSSSSSTPSPSSTGVKDGDTG